MAAMRSLTLLALVLAVTACSQAPEAERPRHVLLVVADTLRSDRLGCYGYPRATSPEVDALAARGTLYENCYAQGCWTVPSMISMMTGVQVAQREANLPENLVVLAEALRAHGMDTSAFPANQVLVTGRGFDRGFAHFQEDAGNRTAIEVAEMWRAWYDERLADPERRAQPFFSWVQFIDPHDPYQPGPEHDVFDGLRVDHEELLERWRAAMPGVKERAEADERKLVKLAQAVERMTRTSNLYDGEVRATSDGLGRILEALEASGELEETLVIFCADHGEMLYEHAQEPLLVDAFLEAKPAHTASVEEFFGVGHRPWFYEEQWNTPLILAGPGIPEGVRREGLAANLDIYPTLLEALDLAPVPHLQGQSLFTGREPTREVVHAYGHQSTALREESGVKFWTQPRKLHHLEGEGLDPAVFLDLSVDPSEEHDFAAERPEETDRLRAELQAWRELNARDVLFALTEEQRAVLEKLGYIGAGMQE